jgi:outer membrane murein-binding lipoprotein Lpp
LKGLLLLSVIFGSLLLAGCSGGEEKAPSNGEVATSKEGEAAIKKNGVPTKGSGQTIDINR